jgi:hypothetical protein
VEHVLTSRAGSACLVGSQAFADPSLYKAVVVFDLYLSNPF